MPERRFKVLACAYACNPYQGSEKGVGWGWVNTIAEHHEVWVLTDEINKTDIDRKVAEAPGHGDNIHFHYIPRTRWLTLEKLWPPSYLWTYQLWQKEAYSLAVQLHKEIGFDLVHQLTYVGFRVPGYLWKMDIPFVWGPIGGLENTPWRFLPMLGFKGCVYYGARNIINMLHKILLLSVRRAFRKADGGAIAATEGIRREIRTWYGRESEVICEIGPPDKIATRHSVRKSDEPLRLAWSGLHDPAKALPLLLYALASLSGDVDWQLDILGSGQCSEKWQKLAKKLAVDNKCRWHGWLPRAEAVQLVHDAHILVITSLKDLTSTVLIEALSQGVPVICPDHCGFQNIVTEDCGIKVPIEKPAQLIADISSAVEMLARDEHKRCLLAEGALRRTADFSWEKKAEILNMLYPKQVDAYGCIHRDKY
ncbi:MAG: hypothetical protein C0402_09470 [Thermodesulfovibrio sp.]|nr:hypothetical protein [Thermodesulfovibrio sp.]